MSQWSAGLLPAPLNVAPGFKALEQAVNTAGQFPVALNEARVVDTNYPPGNVRRYGAVCDRMVDDTSAVQACVTYCLSQTPVLAMDVSGVCRLGSAVNIDIPINSTNSDFRIWSSTGGGFYVTTAIAMFSSTIPFATAPVSQRIVFSGVLFKAVANTLAAYVLDDARFMRIKFIDGCAFDKIKLLRATSAYTQSVGWADCTIVGWSGAFFSSEAHTYDCHTSGNLVEAGQHYISAAFPVGCGFHDTTEGLSGTAIRYNGAVGLDISGYFETNDIDVDGRALAGETSVGVHIHGSLFDHLPSGAYAPSSAESVLWGACTSCSSIGNYGSSKLHRLLATSQVSLDDSAAVLVSNLQGHGAVVRGQIAANGAITAGSGFSVTKGTAGLYTITFTTPFAAAPVFTASPLDSNASSETVAGTPSAGSVAVTIRTGTNAVGDCAFCFTATGV